MTKIVDLDDLLPDDIEFRYRGESYYVAGDISIAETLKLLKLTLALHSEEDEAKQEKILLEIEGEMLRLLQVRHPEMKQLPFGMQGVVQVARALLTQMGVIDPDEEDGDALPPTETNTPTPTTTKSQRSSGSTGSEKSSGSRSTTGRR